MPQTASAKKALRVSERRRIRNIRTKDAYREARKVVSDAVKAGDIKIARENLPKAYAQIDMAVKKGVLHANTGSRYKSRLAAQVNKAAAN